MARSMPRPTDVELQILDVFWQHGPMTVRQAHNLILQTEGRCDTSYSTTLKMIQVLYEKGFLSRDELVRPQVYAVVVSREETQKSILHDLAQRDFGHGGFLTLSLHPPSARRCSSPSGMRR